MAETASFRQRLSFAWWWICVVAKLGFASALVIGILVAYGLKFQVASAGPFALGLYGELQENRIVSLLETEKADAKWTLL
jgi:hypothetical protein